MNDIKTLFCYPSPIWDHILVYSEQIDKHTFYNISIEGCIYYDSLEDGIVYLKKLKDKYYEWLLANNYDPSKSKTNRDCLYKTYDISIYKDDAGIQIMLSAPKFLDILETYEWLKGVINQLETINQNYFYRSVASW